MSLKIRNAIGTELAKALACAKDRRPILEAMGLQLVSLAKRSFSDSSLRPTPWPARKSGGAHPLLRKSGALWQSIRIVELAADHVTVGSDRIYAAHQQLGSKKQSGRGSGVPPRPFLPIYSSGQLTPIAQEKLRIVAMAKLAALLK